MHNIDYTIGFNLAYMGTKAKKLNSLDLGDCVSPQRGALPGSRIAVASCSTWLTWPDHHPAATSVETCMVTYSLFMAQYGGQQSSSTTASASIISAFSP